VGAGAGVKAIAIAGLIAEAVNKGIFRGQPFQNLSKTDRFLRKPCNLHSWHGSESPNWPLMEGTWCADIPLISPSLPFP